MNRRPRTTAGALLLAAACGGGRAPAPAAEAVGPQETIAGRVTVLGHTPFEQVMVLPDDPDAPGVEVTGPLRDEIRAATGAYVRVRGTITAPGRIHAERYEIVSIAGAKPLVGWLRSEREAMVLELEGADRVVRLTAVPEELRSRTGAKAWLVLGEDGAVRAFGILREPAP